ncbi:MAG: hypothetical protein MJK04_11495 [Psychrosphaera sp.]|nr:hypothetical protein [Psychrosphaera sp.]
MSNLLSTTAVKASLVLGLVAASFGASAEQITFKQMVDYSVAQTMMELEFDLQAQLEQSIYTSAFAQVNDAGAPTGRRPVVSITELAPTEEDEE